MKYFKTLVILVLLSLNGIVAQNQIINSEQEKDCSDGYELFSNDATSKEKSLQSGPMLGYSDFYEVLLWVQTRGKSNVYFEYWKEFDSRSKRKTKNVITKKENAFTAKCIIDNLDPDTVYNYNLFINTELIKFPYQTTFKTQSYWDKKRVPQDFKLAIGSCVYINDDKYDGIGKGYGGEYHIFNSILDKKPDFMMWLGDNIYLRGGDWNSSEGIKKRYTQTRSLQEMQPLLASVHNYAIWDDHDFGPNDGDSSFIHKDKALEGFKLFWGNPSYGLPGQKGITTMFSWQDADFFLLDNRYFRSPILRKTGERTMLGKKQLEWLIDALTFSQANFKMIVFGGLVLSTEKGMSQNYINGYEEERTYLFKRIEEENLKNVIFLTGDKHYSEASKIINNNGDEVYEFSFSTLTAKVNTRDFINYNQIEGSLVQKRNFGLLEFTGPKDNRKLKVNVYDSFGNIQWSKSLNHIQD